MRSPVSTLSLTVSLRSIPKHDTSERRVLATGLCGDASQRRRIDIVARVSGPRGSRSTDVNLDIFVGRSSLGPVVPLAEVPTVGVTELWE